MRIAIVGTGISGMLIARLLCDEHEVCVFEAGDYIGGHTNTIDVEAYGKRYSVDTGFMVFNERTYPNFVRMLRLLGVEWQSSDMSFSVRVERSGLEYNGTSFNTLFAQRINLMRPSFWRMLTEIVRFNQEAKSLASLGFIVGGLAFAPPTEADCEISLREFLSRYRFPRRFFDNYLAPMASAIWSCPAADVLGFPAKFFCRFFSNHGLLDIRNRPQWFTVAGSSRRYVEALTKPYRDHIRLSTPVRRIERAEDGVTILSAAGPERFDAVVLATHADTSLALLDRPSQQEQEILSAFKYQPNEAIVHSDERLLPRCKRAWASWNTHVFDDPARPAAVTYYLNRLQSLDAPGPICVTLGNSDRINPKCVLRRIMYHHPVYSQAAVAAQPRWPEINGVARTYYCGAYWGYGFHEDGVNSALAVGKLFGKSMF